MNVLDQVQTPNQGLSSNGLTPPLPKCQPMCYTKIQEVFFLFDLQKCLTLVMDLPLYKPANFYNLNECDDFLMLHGELHNYKAEKPVFLKLCTLL